MKIHIPIPRLLGLAALASGCFAVSTMAQEILIPDPNFNAVIREALQKPTGPVTQADMLSLTGLSAIFRNITNVQGLEAAQNLVALDLQDNRITSFNFPTNLTKLTTLDLSENRFPQLTLPGGMTNLTTLRLENGRLTNFSLSAGLSKLTSLRVGFNQLSSLALPADMTNLTELSAYQNQLTNLTLPPSLPGLKTLNLDGNQLGSLTVPPGLTSLVFLDVNSNQLNSVTFPADLQQLNAFFMAGNPLTTLVLSEPLASSGLASVVDSLRNQGVGVFTYPLTAQLVRLLPLEGAFKFGITGPPGIYSVLDSTDLSTWHVLSTVTNPLGSINFVDVTAQSAPRKFYQVLQLRPPTNIVFIPPNTFTMGSPANEPDRDLGFCVVLSNDP